MADYYISPTGNDTTGDGSSSTPWLTTSKAHDNSVSGDRVIFKDGTYTAANVEPMSEVRTYIAENTGLAIIDGLQADVAVTVGVKDRTITIVGIVFTGFYRTGASDELPCLIVGQGSEFWLNFRSCTFHDMKFGAGNYTGGMIGATAFNGVGGSFTFDTCLFYDLIDDTNGAQTPTIVYAREKMQFTPDYKILNCTVYFDGSAAINGFFRVPPGGGDMTVNLEVKNSIFYGNGTEYIIASAGTVNNGNDYNCVYNMAANDYVAGSNDITSNPLFLDATDPARDFRLQNSSPCLDTGNVV